MLQARGDALAIFLCGTLLALPLAALFGAGVLRGAIHLSHRFRRRPSEEPGVPAPGFSRSVGIAALTLGIAFVLVAFASLLGVFVNKVAPLQ